MLENIQHLTAVHLAGLSALSLFFAIFFATFISEDAACIAAGALAAAGEVSLPFAIAACFLGIVAGDLGLYWVGRALGKRIFGFKFVGRFVSERYLSRASDWLDRRGASAVFVSRFITGLRLPTYLAAGALRTNFWKFALYFFLAAAVWTPILVGSVALSDGLFGGSIIFTAVGVFILVRLAMKLGSWRGRRLAIGKLKRIPRWEFWPLWVFYLPVAAYVLLLAIRHRSLTVFTCANPAIPAGGFVGESKNEIYSLLAADEHNRAFLLRHRRISGDLLADARIALADDFMTRNDLSFPIVVKPDAGERGKGVRIVNSHDDLAAALTASDRDQVIQEFARGSEVSVFYYRHPLAATGSIFSITEKIFPAVTGDGASTLEHLILRDDRAVCLAEKYFAENAGRLDHVPRDGEQVQIIGIGTHSRGAIFLDGEHFRTAELEQAIDEICRRVEGFNFGRFDIRYSSLDGFRSGRGFKIIELNGVTSESTNIYDPRYSLIDAYRILFGQWRLAFEIGAANREIGARTTRLTSLCRIAIASIFATAG